MNRFAVILPAAGNSVRFQGPGLKKPFAKLSGVPVWQRSVRVFLDRTDVHRIMLVVAEADRDTFETELTDVDDRVLLVVGGPSRAQSVHNAFVQLADTIDFVAIHDVARPLLTQKVIDRVFEMAGRTGAALPGIPVTSTVKEVCESGRIERTVDRSRLKLAQTPQVFSRAILADAYVRAGERLPEFTDEASLVESAGYPVFVVDGCTDNIKITTTEDLTHAEAVIARRGN